MPRQNVHETEKRLDAIKTILLKTKSKPLTTSEIRSKLDGMNFTITQRQVQRDLGDLESRYRGLVKRERVGKENLFSLPSGALPSAGIMKRNEAVALRILETQCARSFPERIWVSLRPYFHSALELLKKDALNNRRVPLADKVVDVPFGVSYLPPKISDEVLDEILQALEDEQKLEITYQPVNKTASKSIVLPLGVASQANRLYLIARRDGSDKTLPFAVTRIQEAKRCAGEKFWYPKDFNLQEFAEKAMKYAASDEVITLKAMLKDTHLVQTLRETPINITQKIQDQKDGSILLTIDIEDTWALSWWVFSQAELIEVLEPTSYREKIGNRLKAAAQLYS